jgi:hypothetical protein
MFSNHIWSPKQPKNFVSSSTISEHSLEEMVLPYFSFVGGEQSFFSEIGINKDHSLTLENLHKVPLLVSINNMINAIKDMEVRTLTRLRKDFEGLNLEDEKDMLIAVQKMMLQCSTEETKKSNTGGYIVWLKLQPNKENPLECFQPLPCNYYSDLAINTEYIDTLPFEVYVEQVKDYLHSLTNEQLIDNSEEVDSEILINADEQSSNSVRENAVIDLMKAIIVKKKQKNHVWWLTNSL